MWFHNDRKKETKTKLGFQTQKNRERKWPKGFLFSNTQTNSQVQVQKKKVKKQIQSCVSAQAVESSLRPSEDPKHRYSLLLLHGGPGNTMILNPFLSPLDWTYSTTESVLVRLSRVSVWLHVRVRTHYGCACLVTNFFVDQPFKCLFCNRDLVFRQTARYCDGLLRSWPSTP